MCIQIYAYTFVNYLLTYFRFIYVDVFFLFYFILIFHYLSLFILFCFICYFYFFKMCMNMEEEGSVHTC